jgi:pyrimidine-nucleoside phosphorylase
MRPLSAIEIIARKRDGFALTPEEIAFLVQGFTEGEIPDYQAAAFLMAVYLKSMNRDETLVLTKVMADSGIKLDLGDVPGIKVDKHSTGGVGDKTTLVVAPLVAAAGVPVAKLSGRALGHTGGTLDKLESIPGLRTSLSRQEFASQVKEIGVAIATQSEEMVPADKKLYALRDLTATAGSPPLIASSVMSKKLSGGADAIVLDVKTGSGAFLPTLQESLDLASLMLYIGTRARRRMAAVVSDMDQPLGYAVGNSLEVMEAMETLQGHGPSDLVELCLVLGGLMLEMAEVARNDEARSMLRELLENGKAWEKFFEMAESQGGDIRYLRDPELFPRAALQSELLAEGDGFLQKANARTIGKAALALAAGGRASEDRTDRSAGIILKKKMGDRVQKGEVLALLYSNNAEKLARGREIAESAFVIHAERVAPPTLVHRILK